jgi:hypothetical protein
VIPALGDGQRHDAEGRVDQQLQHLGQLLRREQVIEMGADDTHTGVTLGRRDGKRIQTILGPELVGLLPAPFATG